MTAVVTSMFFLFFQAAQVMEQKDLCDLCLNEITESMSTQRIRGEVDVGNLSHGNKKHQTGLTLQPPV